MAHFAELESKTDPTGFTSDTHLVVKRVVVVANDYVSSDEHEDGETWCINFFGGGAWKQTSYNNNFRKQYAGIGFVYNESKNKFLSPQPFASWSIDSNDNWQSPVTYPNGDQSAYIIRWEEDNLRWLASKISDNSNYRWDADNTQWVSI
tara:strand:- start:982 stop:1428 length:447 start_codon:yes stop_codon:yes gene_type:complete